MTAVTFRVLAGLMVCLMGAAGARADAALYGRLGGADGVAAIANMLIDRVAADPVLGRSFKDSKLSRIKKVLAEQLCDLSGGPCRYTGDSMKQIHAGQHITQAEFYGMVAALRGVLKERHVDLRSTNELLRLLAPMKRDVVEHTDTGTAVEPPLPSTR